MMEVLLGALVVLLATSAGALSVFFIGCADGRKNAMMLAFSAGAMAFSVVEMLSESHRTAGDAALLAGFSVGVAALMVSEKMIPHVHMHIRKKEIEKSKKKALMIGGAIAIHNIPEGLAIATAFASSTPLGWLVTSVIAIQDAPEGALISAPLACYGMSRTKAALFGILSGVVEAAAAVSGFFFLRAFSGIVPGALAFSAGAMSYVILVELIPDAMDNGNQRIAATSFIIGAAIAFGISFLLTG
jgi:ZIP family zinc transporter